MRTAFAEFLDQMQHIADADNTIVQARHYDVLDYYFKIEKTPQQAFLEYKNNFLPRWNAITENGRFTESDRILHTHERFYTEKELSDLQSAVHKITGNGEVMQLFNKLLGVAVC